MIRPIRRHPRTRRLAGSSKTLSRGGEAGAMTLSYVIIVPVFLVGIMVIVQMSIWYLARESVLAAARHGADVARTSQPPPGTGAQAAISFATSATTTFLRDVTASTRGTTAATVRITVSARIPSLVPGLTIRVREVVTAPVERFVALGNLSVPARAGLAPAGAAGPAAASWRAAASRPWLVRS
ncbi:MAG TPA: TadE family protein [Streptosporangiaceae bacterium]|nr:TadE family protein [Streptosporangiaceae bacterium]